MRPILSMIEKWIGPKWSALIAFAAIYGVTLPDLTDVAKGFAAYTADNPELIGNGLVAAALAYLFRAARTETPVLTNQLPTEYDDLDDYDAPLYDEDFDTQIPTATILKPARNWFTDAELDCNCQDLPGCDYQGMHPTVLAIANDLRERFGALFVNSGYRCPAYNAATPGASLNSYHMKGMAIDLRSNTVSPETMYTYLVGKYPDMYGIGLYGSFIHIDCRTGVYARKSSPESDWAQFMITSPDINLAQAA